MLKVGIVDDHSLFRFSLKMLINSYEHMTVVIDASSGDEFLSLLSKIKINLLLLDIQMPGLNGYEVCRAVRIDFPNIRILIISQYSNEDCVRKSIDSGAHGIFNKSSNPEQLIQAIEMVQFEDFYVDTSLGQVVQAMVQKHHNDECINNLSLPISKRELEIIEMACRGLNSTQIADKLFISARTVETHRKRIMVKTNSKNFLGSILYSIKIGLIRIDDV